MARKDEIGKALRAMYLEERKRRERAIRPIDNETLANMFMQDAEAAGLRCTREQTGYILSSRVSIHDYLVSKGNLKGFQRYGTRISKRVLAILEAYLWGHTSDVPKLIAGIVENEQRVKRTAPKNRSKNAKRRSDAKKAEASIRFMHAPRKPPQGEEYEPDPIRENAIRILEDD